MSNDFVFTLWDGKGSFLDYKKEKALDGATWFDKFITYFLLFFPLVFVKGIYIMLSNFLSK